MSSTSHTIDSHQVSLFETRRFFNGLASSPKLIYRTGAPWSLPNGPEAYTPRKSLVPVFRHPIRDVWKQTLSQELVDLLDARKILFTTIDVVHFEESDSAATADKPGFLSPVTIWIGVLIDSTTTTVAHEATEDILGLLTKYDIHDIDVSFRESIYVCGAGPTLLSPDDDVFHLEIISPITHTLGLSIASMARPNIEGTMALYLAEGGESGRLLGLTCRHVVLPDEPNTPFLHNDVAQEDVIVPGNTTANKISHQTRAHINSNQGAINQLNKNMESLEVQERCDDEAVATSARSKMAKLEPELTRLTAELEALQTLEEDFRTHWMPIENRVIGHVVFAPPIAFIPLCPPSDTASAPASINHRIEDWSILVLERPKLGTDFMGNTIDLGIDLSLSNFLELCTLQGDATWKVIRPFNGLLPLSGIIPEDYMTHPTTLDKKGQPCLLVVKTGNETGTTIGRANGLESVVRQYSPLREVIQTSLEWCILPHGSPCFTDNGDSGSIVAGIDGRIGGMVIGGCGNGNSAHDITYVTPFWWLLERIRQEFPNAHLDIEI
ncbi:hypothetical protein DL96DRAFT_1552860 [Flagelloscypha sp. PMI_526]|nr:hypothetical protein DL96DRAFT_1552860 [Flagelloscypha sp. PMI_526]